MTRCDRLWLARVSFAGLLSLLLALAPMTLREPSVFAGESSAAIGASGPAANDPAANNLSANSTTAEKPAAKSKRAEPAKADADPDEPLAPDEPTAIRPVSAKLEEAPLTDYDRQHWAFCPLRRPEPPSVARADWTSNPIDRFILARLEQEQLAPQPAADRGALLRRVTFDLTGLPPTPAELAAFLADDAPDAFERVVDRLLASPGYGERWAQHWLDLARFAETDGFEHDKLRPQAWRYRDWTIEALNADLPFDEFVRRQLAGDELRPGDTQAAIATGFLLAGPDMPDINLKEERRHMLLNEITATVGSTLLGLQMGCAQCHDHKFDPISQADFYRLRAIFEPAEVFANSKTERVIKETGKIPVSRVMLRGDFRQPGPEVEAGFPRIANLADERVPPPAAGQKSSGRRSALAQWLTRADHPLTTRVIVNWLWQQHFGVGLTGTPGDFGVMGDGPSHPELLDWLATEISRRGWSLKAMSRLIVTSSAYRQSTGVASPRWSAAETRAAANNLERAVAADPGNRLLARMHRRRLEGEAIRDAMLAAGEALSPRSGGPGVMPPLPKELLATLLPGQWKATPDEEDHRRRSVYLFARRNLRYPMFEAFDRPETIASCPRRSQSTTAPQALYLLNSDFSLQCARYLAGRILQADEATGELDPLVEGAAASNLVAERVGRLYRRALGRAPTRLETLQAESFLAAQATRIASVAATTTAGAKGAAAAALPIPLPADETAPAEASAWVQLCLAMFNLNEFIYVD